jgi:hypothetical protein
MEDSLAHLCASETLQFLPSLPEGATQDPCNLISDLLHSHGGTWTRPTGCPEDLLPPIVQLQKSIYGLPQASKYFDEHLSNNLDNMGFCRCISDPQIFILEKDGQKAFLLKHVVDCLVASQRGSNLLSFIESSLSEHYSITAIFEPTNFVGLVITRNRA